MQLMVLSRRLRRTYRLRERWHDGLCVLINLVLLETRQVAKLPAHSMPTCCQRYCIGLIETRGLETLQGCLQIGLGFAHTRRTCLCSVNSPAT